MDRALNDRKKMTDIEVLRRTEAVLRIFAGCSTVPREAARLGVDALLLADWVSTATSAVAAAMHRTVHTMVIPASTMACA